MVDRYHNIDGRWFAGGLLITSVLAVADVGKTWYWFPHAIPVPLSVYALCMLFVYTSWVIIAIFIGWFRKALEQRVKRNTLLYSIHGVTSVAIGVTHLLMNAIIVWAMFAVSRPLTSFWTLYIEKLLRWLPYEVLAYWGCLAVFLYLALQKKQRAVSENAQQKYQQHFVVKKDTESLIVNSAEVDYIKALDNYVVLGTLTGRHIVHDTMNRLETALDPRIFHRIHRSAIVNLNRIAALEKDESNRLLIRMKDGEKFPISRRRRSSLRKELLRRKEKPLDTRCERRIDT